MERNYLNRIQTSANYIAAEKFETTCAILALTLLAMIPVHAFGQPVQTVVTDLSVIVDGGVGGKPVFPVANSYGLTMPKGTVHSRLHVAPKAAVRALPVTEPRKKATLLPKKDSVSATTKPQIQPVATPGPKPKVVIQAVQKQKPVPLAKVETKPPPLPKVSKEVPEAQTIKTKPLVTAEPAVTPKKMQTAVISNKITLKPGKAMSVIFEGFATNLPDLAKSKLSQIASAIRETKDYRVQLMAYAGGEGLLTSKVRRISLSRALAVRSFLIEKGIRSTQIDVRALGNKTIEKPVNRVDINLEHR